MGEPGAVGVVEVVKRVQSRPVGKVGLLLSGVKTDLELFLKRLAVIAVDIDILGNIAEGIGRLASVELRSEMGLSVQE